MAELRRVAVFCGSSPGGRPAYMEAARTLGAALAAEGLGLVYGGGRVGLMGAVADAVLEAGGEATGVIPYALVQREVAHAGLTELYVVDTMHERKAQMAALADAF
ncbi:MAG TPA: TIGR00730 family Rossman fold protein, partial [Rhodothermales bacterium]|nr:TIGR00730 family Rossman fold protein [Rhodothermales bacterium]